MPFKPNYNLQRTERARLKQAKQEAKRRERAEAATRRKAEGDASPELDPGLDKDAQASPAASRDGN